jgi:uncharacterized membrane-anchored protein
MTATLRILLVVALQTAALGYMIFDRGAILNSRDVITLKVQPVDPSDMFRGDYVILSYDISQLDLAVLPGDDRFMEGRWAYVTLANHNGVWTPVAVNDTMPARPPGTVVLRGKVESGGNGGPLRLTYGIESFFVPQGQGKPIEDERQKGEISADIAIDAEGRGAIKSLRRTDGTVIHTESLF